MPKLSVTEECEALVKIMRSGHPGSTETIVRELDKMSKKRGLAVLARLLNYLQADKTNGDAYVTRVRLALTNRV